MNLVTVTGRAGEGIAWRSRREWVEERLREPTLQTGELGRVWPAGVSGETTAVGRGARPQTSNKGTEEREEFKVNEHGKMNTVRGGHRGRERWDRSKPK